MPSGTIAIYTEAKGYGFITPDAGPPDVYFHVSRVVDDEDLILPGARVTYSVAILERGPQAVQVHVTASPAYDGPRSFAPDDRT